jgi:hypothetical protein
MSWGDLRCLGCWSYVEHALTDEIRGFGVGNYECDEIIEIAVLLGATCAGNIEKYGSLGAKLQAMARARSADVAERNKLMRFANYLMQKTRSFYTTRAPRFISNDGAIEDRMSWGAFAVSIAGPTSSTPSRTRSEGSAWTATTAARSS